MNVALEWIRSRNRLGSVALDEGKAAAEVAEPDASEMARVPREVLMRFVSELPEGYRTVFNLYCIEEYSHREIARMLGINEKSSSSQLFRARTMLARNGCVGFEPTTALAFSLISVTVEPISISRPSRFTGSSK
mgnify:CR=1 FL=1